MNKQKLEILAAGLVEIPQENFNMGYYRSRDGWVPEGKSWRRFRAAAFKSPENCGTAGCAIGSAPFIPGLEPVEADYSYCNSGEKYLDFGTYSTRVLEITEADSDLDGPWEWCFDAEWCEIDNTPRGAAKRIRYLIANGEPPKGWENLSGHIVHYEELLKNY